jgi:hypothetical protein
MSFALNIETNFSPEEVKDTIRSALEHEKHVAKYKVKRYSLICEEYEKKFGFDSKELRTKLETKDIREESDFFNWYAAKRGLDYWSKKLVIISDIRM